MGNARSTRSTSQQTSRSQPSAVWNVMVFMVAEPVPGETDLRRAALRDIESMNAVFEGENGADGSDGGLNLFVQVHGVESQPYRLANGERDKVPQKEQESANGNALASFMRWALTEAPKSDYLLLVLWGHAYEFEIGRSVNRTKIDGLDFGELTSVLDGFTRYYKKPLDIIGFDACDLATIEMAYQLRTSAQYLLASEIGIPIPGWPYRRILKRINDPIGRQMGPAELGSYIVRRYCESYVPAKATVALSLLDLSYAEDVKELAGKLARRLAIAIGDDLDERSRIYDMFLRSQTIEDKPFVDAADLCLALLRECGDVSVREVAEELGDFLISPGPVTPGESKTGEGRAFIAEHGRNACQTAKLQGVSLYAPHVATQDPAKALEFYKKLAFTQETLWGKLVAGLAGSKA
jgi:Clostripain family